ncbi:alkyl hydroperoxide reductase/ Thiol specific antioxidant/ Mal allergen [Allomuricauda ruestringensis DSM 13258]|uniref:Alkyl hydroperoxide reductase/ Thiol specific antioxidant/ Mal allergen n=1 Tax=Allomuricauda ruestringensis (strain DSM 13258 / CIP 107369 / LMG 19739 / B1) TaxID=886377 RepID=G2PM88_ALLRU|nr:alkyl hydroperoxide reductase/ Thiol specific antioxidant/ Mal allergen [Allomuricauda ruestringensis DSM 13258]
MKKTKILGWSALALIFVAAFAMGFKAATEHNFDAGYEVGDMAADFSLKNVDGTMVSLSDFDSAKGFLVIFTCNTCPYAQAYEDRIIALDAKYKPQGVPVIAINPNNPSAKPGDSFAKMKERAAEKGFTFPYLFDEGQKIYPQYGATRTPHVFLLEKKDSGNMVKYIGAIDDNYQDASQVDEKFVENAVDAMLAGNEINPKTTKAIGCGIR